MLSETSSTGLATLAAADFAERLAAREPVPGGGGAAALVGPSIATAEGGMPREDPARADVVEAALHEAALPPYRTMVSCARALMALEELGQKGSRMLLSDVACGAHLCRAAMEASSVNVFVNTASMRDRARAAELERECDALLCEWVPRARKLSAAMTAKVRRES